MLKDEQGFTLIEVVTALAVFAVGILAVQTMQHKAVTTNYSAASMTRAVGQGIDTVERILALDYNDSLLAGGAMPVAHDDAEFPAEWGKIANSSIVWQVTDDTPMPNMKTINLDVTTVVRGMNKTVSFTYYKAEII